MEIKGVTKEETAYGKEMTISYEGQEYEVVLHWDKWDGYDVRFINAEEPEWAINWEDNNEESLAYTLDNLTDEVLESEVPV
jgi:hypothetical protein